MAAAYASTESLATRQAALRNPTTALDMTIAVIWQEDGFQWCAADTRLVAGPQDKPTTEIGSKIFAIPLGVSALEPDGFMRQPHYCTQYGFVYAGSALPASLTAVTASTLVQKAARPGGQADPPTFEQIAELVHRLAKRFMAERRRFEGDGLFDAGLFGWCPRKNKYKIARVEGKADPAGFRVELSYPEALDGDGQPWLVLGGAAPTFKTKLAEYVQSENHITNRIPRHVIESMVSEASDATVGGATSVGVASRRGFELCFTLEPIEPGEPAACRVLNGLDMDTEIGQVGDYVIATGSIA